MRGNMQSVLLKCQVNKYKYLSLQQSLFCLHRQHTEETACPRQNFTDVLILSHTAWQSEGGGGDQFSHKTSASIADKFYSKQIKRSSSALCVLTCSLTKEWFFRPPKTFFLWCLISARQSVKVHSVNEEQTNKTPSVTYMHIF